jgi:hypothetical protein
MLTRWRATPGPRFWSGEGLGRWTVGKGLEGAGVATEPLASDQEGRPRRRWRCMRHGAARRGAARRSAGVTAAAPATGHQ